MVKKGSVIRLTRLVSILALLAFLIPNGITAAQDEGPVILDPALGVRTVVEGLTTPISMAFLNEDEMFIVEKNTGQVKHVVGNAVQNVVLDLAVNFSSERGLLGITLDPDFGSNGFVYLYWTCGATAPPAESPYFPTQIECADEPLIGDDTEDILAVPLLGNRVDRFVWDGTSLTWDRNLIKLRVFQNDGAPIPRGQGDAEQLPLGNHDGGVITFGEDGKLYIIIGDVGRRGALQNLPFGPVPSGQGEAITAEGLEGPESQGNLPEDQLEGQIFSSRRARLAPVATDDQFGGPQPDDAHYTGVIVRLNNDGTIPTDNPFYRIGSRIGGEIGENIQMTFAYGIRNSFGMDVDPVNGNVWISENGEDAYDELNLVRPGFNSGWIQTMGPAGEVADYKEIESTSLHNEAFPNLQQFRWGPENIADTKREALRRLFSLPGSRFSDPEFSWEFAVAPAAIGFVKGEGLGESYQGDLFVGLSLPLPLGGPLLRFDLSDNRAKIAGIDEPEAENEDFNSLIGSEDFLIGTNFGVVTDIETSPNGNLFVVSLSSGAVYEVFQQTEAASVHLKASMTGTEEVPPGDPDGTGKSNVSLNTENNSVCFSTVVTNIALPAAAAHIHVGEAGVAGAIVIPLTPPDEFGNAGGCVSNVDPALVQAIIAEPSNYYVNVHNAEFQSGAVRGQLTE